MTSAAQIFTQFLVQNVLDNAMLPVNVTGNTALNSTSITGVSSIVGVFAGATIQGVNIPAGTTVVSASGTTIVISQPALGAATAGQLIIQAIQNSNAYWQGVNTGKAALLAQSNSILAKIQTAAGKMVTQVTIPGQGTTFVTELSLFDQAACYSQAYNILSGNITIVRRTASRYF